MRPRFPAWAGCASVRARGQRSRHSDHGRGPRGSPATARPGGVVEPRRSRRGRRPAPGGPASDGSTGHQGGPRPRGRPPRTGPPGEGAEGVALPVGDRRGPVLRPPPVRVGPFAPVPPARSQDRTGLRASRSSPKSAPVPRLVRRRASSRRPVRPPSRPGRPSHGWSAGCCRPPSLSPDCRSPP